MQVNHKPQSGGTSHFSFQELRQFYASTKYVPKKYPSLFLIKSKSKGFLRVNEETMERAGCAGVGIIMQAFFGGEGSLLHESAACVMVSLCSLPGDHLVSLRTQLPLLGPFPRTNVDPTKESAWKKEASLVNSLTKYFCTCLV